MQNVCIQKGVCEMFNEILQIVRPNDFMYKNTDKYLVKISFFLRLRNSKKRRGVEKTCSYFVAVINAFLYPKPDKILLLIEIVFKI